MFYLFLGLMLWSGAHLMRRLAPGVRATLGEGPGKGVIALLLVLSIWLMYKGYGMADGAVLWGRSPALAGINNLLMLLAVYMFAASSSKTALARRIRHPMLGGVKVWALAHLLVNGDVQSIILFGGLLAWAVVQMIVINKAEPEWVRPDPAPREKEIKVLVGTVVVFAVIAGIHMWLGYQVFG